MIEQDRLMQALVAATYAYDEAIAEERAAAREYTADLKAVAEVGERRRKATAKDRHAAYEAYLLARNNYDAQEETDD